jgi:hypothetical protein
MSTRWEYLTVTWTLTATPPAATGQPWRLEGAYRIVHAGHAEVRTRTYDATAPSTAGDDLLAELGAEGWELVSHVIDRTAVAPSQGYETAGVPIASRQIFKRPLA